MNNLDEALNDFSAALKKEYKKEEIYYYLGKIFHHKMEFKTAISYYKEFLRMVKSDNELRKSVVWEVKRCAYGLRKMKTTQLGFVENFGDEVNTRFNETHVVQSPNHDGKYYFSSDRKGSTGGRRDEMGLADPYSGYFSDMYSVSFEDGIWINTETINPLLNSAKNEWLLDFNSDGSVLFFASSLDKMKGKIYTDTFKEEFQNQLFPSELDAPLVGSHGDIYMSLCNDSTIIFSSKRIQGYGGYDLYITAYRNNQWSMPINLGPKINTAYDEVSPYLSKDGLTLYYSSNGTNSIGGFDIMKSVYNRKNRQWSRSENMGIPINSPGDDLHYRISRDNISATFCSDRKDGYGGMDIFILYLKEPAIESEHYGELAFLELESFNPKESIASNYQSSNRNKDQNLGNQRSRLPETPKRIEKRDVHIVPIYYEDDSDFLNVRNKKNLNVLFDMMTIYPDLKVEMVCHSLKEGIPAYELYFSIKRAEMAQQYLVDKGIDPNRFILKGVGSNYPIARIDDSRDNNRSSEKLNKRIDFVLHSVDEKFLEVTYEQPAISYVMRDRRFELYKTIVDGLSYKIQIASVNRIYQNDIIQNFTDTMVEKDPITNKYLYTVGLYQEYEAAQALVKNLKELESERIFIVPYVNGIRIESDDMVDYAKIYPDLVNFLQYND